MLGQGFGIIEKICGFEETAKLCGPIRSGREHAQFTFWGHDTFG